MAVAIDRLPVTYLVTIRRISIMIAEKLYLPHFATRDKIPGGDTIKILSN